MSKFIYNNILVYATDKDMLTTDCVYVLEIVDKNGIIHPYVGQTHYMKERLMHHLYHYDRYIKAELIKECQYLKLHIITKEENYNKRRKIESEYIKRFREIYKSKLINVYN